MKKCRMVLIAMGILCLLSGTARAVQTDTCSLTVLGPGIFRLYRVAQQESDGSLTAIGPFADMAVSLEADCAEAWRSLTGVVLTYIAQRGIAADQEKSARDEKAVFGDLLQGLYLVVGKADGKRAAFLVMLPGGAEGGLPQYAVTAQAKYEPAEDGLPGTGDAGGPIKWAAMAFLSAGSMLCMAAVKRKNNGQK